MPYKHGGFAELQGTQDMVAPSGGATLPVYFGRLPVHQLEDFSAAVNRPLLVSSLADATRQGGYSDNWADFDLCEAIYAHFNNDIGPVGPIVLVNVLDPGNMVLEEQTASVALTRNVGVISRDDVILKTVSIAGKVRGTDFTAEYTPAGDKVTITDLTGALVSPVTVAFDAVLPDDVEAAEVIGGTAVSGVKTGIAVVDLVYLTHNMIPTIMDAPAWSHISTVDAALKAGAQKINGHWYAWVNSNIDCSATGADTIAEAKTWKNTNGYDGAGEAPCWPMALNAGKKFHLSTLATVTMQRVDFDNDNTPHETPSNKPVDVTGMCLADGTPIVFDQMQANDLNSKGIRTLSYWGGRWVLWGPHTGAYEFGKDMDPREKFDCSVRMLYHLMNGFQLKYGMLVDKPMNRAMVDTILNDFQRYLDGLVAKGALLYGEIRFTELSNPTSDIVEGDFDFDIATTTTPPGKSLTAKIAYTIKGFSALFGGAA